MSDHHQFTKGTDRSGSCRDCTFPERDHDIAMMKDPDAWPQWPLLPLKRHVTNDLDCGFIMEQPDKDAKILYHATIFEREAMADPDRQIRYESFDAIYDDGWRVD